MWTLLMAMLAFTWIQACEEDNSETKPRVRKYHVPQSQKDETRPTKPDVKDADVVSAKPEEKETETKEETENDSSQASEFVRFNLAYGPDQLKKDIDILNSGSNFGQRPPCASHFNFQNNRAVSLRSQSETKIRSLLTELNKAWNEDEGPKAYQGILELYKKNPSYGTSSGFVKQIKKGSTINGSASLCGGSMSDPFTIRLSPWDSSELFDFDSKPSRDLLLYIAFHETLHTVLRFLDAPSLRDTDFDELVDDVGRTTRIETSRGPMTVEEVLENSRSTSMGGISSRQLIKNHIHLMALHEASNEVRGEEVFPGAGADYQVAWLIARQHKKNLLTEIGTSPWEDSSQGGFSLKNSNRSVCEHN